MKESQYDYDDPNIPEEFFESEEWMEYLEAIRLSELPDQPPVYVSQKFYDTNWQALKEEKSLPKLQEQTVAKIANCKFSIWHDTSRIMATYDVAYTSGKRNLDKHLYGTWDKSDPRLSAESLAYDAVMTMMARASIPAQVKFSRMYAPRDVKNQVREINLIEVFSNQPQAAWFVVNDNVYTARYEELADKYVWYFNGQKKMTVKEFCDYCWNAI